MLLEGTIEEGDRLNVVMKDGRLDFDVQRTGKKAKKKRKGKGGVDRDDVEAKAAASS